MHRLGPRDPSEIGGFELIARLGSGGMGIVYLARRGLQRVALKVLSHYSVAEPAQRERFAREAEALQRVDSPHISSLLDWSITPDEAWLALEFINGPTLREVVRSGGPVAPHIWYALGKGLVGALRELHSKGIVHRDIKPSNIVISSRGPVLIDFGIADLLDATRLTQTGVIGGSPAWVSPEQIDGDDIGSPSDVFSLGSTLVFAASGHSPWGDDETVRVSAVFRHILEHQPDLSALSSQQRSIASEMLEKNPAARPDARALANTFRDADVGVFRDEEWLTTTREADSRADVGAEFQIRDTGSEQTRESPPIIHPDDFDSTVSLGKDDAIVHTANSRRNSQENEHTTTQPRLVANLPSRRGRRLGQAILLPLGLVLALAFPAALATPAVVQTYATSQAPTLDFEWQEGDTYVQSIDLNSERRVTAETILDEFYTLTGESVIRSSCLPEVEVSEFKAIQTVPVFEVLTPAARWREVSQAVFLGPANCPEGFERTQISVDTATLERWDEPDECTVYRYVEPATSSFPQRFEQWCVSYRPRAEE